MFPIKFRPSRFVIFVIALVLLALSPRLSRSQNAPSSALDGTLIRSTVESASDLIHQEYFDPEMAARLDATLRQSLAENRYDNIKAPEALAAMLTSDLYAVSHDKHLAVTAPPANISGAYAGPGATQQSRAEAVRVSNAGVQRVEILPGNVGYLKVTAFFRPAEEADAIAEAMHMLRHTDALILDMRDNAGGSPDTAAVLASYFFDSPKLTLFDTIPRHGDIEHYATREVADRDGKRPLYVLTSAHTWSAGEGLTFVLQERRRAEVIGETTVGAANSGKPYKINATFSITIPNAYIRTAVRGTSWEGVGVVPDWATTASDALRVAQTRALEQLLSKAPRGADRDLLQQALSQLQQP